MDQTTMNNSMPNMSPVKKSSPMTSIIVIVILILAAVLVMNMTKNKQSKELDAEIVQKQAEIKANDMQAQALITQGESDSTADIEKDLNATNTNSITLE